MKLEYGVTYRGSHGIRGAHIANAGPPKNRGDMGLVKARKERPCDQCGATIAVGQLYLKSISWDPRDRPYAQCIACAEGEANS